MKHDVAELFSGLKGGSAPWADAGHGTVTLDFDARFAADHVRDILTVASLRELEVDGPFTFVWASPPCEGFTVMVMGRNWERDPKTGGILGPKHDDARLAMRIAEHTFKLIDEYAAEAALAGRPFFYVVENPIGALRVMPFTVYRGDHVSTWYCRWPDVTPPQLPRAKPTDLYTNVAGPWPMCKSGNPDHVAAPRGSRTPGSTQGIAGAADRALIPYALASEVRRRVVRELARGKD